MGRERRLPALRAGLIALALVACGSGEDRGKVAAPEPPEASDACGKRQALVVQLHGYSEDAAAHAGYIGLETFAEEHGFLLLAPQGGGEPPRWDLEADVARIGQVIDDAVANQCADPDRVFVSGYSMGGFLASHLACRLADKITAVAPVAGARMVAPCEPSAPVPALIMHGTADNTVLFTGGMLPVSARATGQPVEGPSITAIAEAWAQRNGCASEAVVEGGDEVSVHRWPCPVGAEVELHVVHGGAHGWPTSANERIWEFFNRQ
jgi:polyhydroxybutyrate depolymerase